MFWAYAHSMGKSMYFFYNWVFLMHIGYVMVPRVSEWAQTKKRKQTEAKDGILPNNTHKKKKHAFVCSAPCLIPSERLLLFQIY